ncbi:uncharacterized protein GLRG_11615 [Colletotrichum graminicola M1.001]|uniref:Uncharacterized protein n=1 Tax=Colletotrichum graminicola (strain M1.001 / M2 / FGSC 10212) TaxID=645133 RepID=E3R032_COLGM|nr:uncharacterized protein GLRG_11615 [Colletotrichum graminicola M1.001]EFQ36470.1 hypothetical protein GLRG_11615 [Colletotrichum graminicola M1.001]
MLVKQKSPYGKSSRLRDIEKCLQLSGSSIRELDNVLYLLPNALAATQPLKVASKGSNNAVSKGGINITAVEMFKSADMYNLFLFSIALKIGLNMAGAYGKKSAERLAYEARSEV